MDQTTTFPIVTTLYNSYYGGGACGEDVVSSQTALVSLPWPTGIAFDFAFCGACYLFTGPNGKTSTVKVFDWAPGTGSIVQQRWTLNGYANGPYPTIGCTGGQCNVTVQMVPCPLSGSGTLQLDFNKYNNGYTILVTPRNQLVAIYNCSLTDSVTGANPIWLEHTQAAYVLPNRKVNVPFTLTFYAVTGETITTTVAGLPAGQWPQSNLGSTQSITTSVQFSKTYTGSPAPPPSPSSSSSGSAAGTLVASAALLASAIVAALSL